MHTISPDDHRPCIRRVVVNCIISSVVIISLICTTSTASAQAQQSYSAVNDTDSATYVVKEQFNLDVPITLAVASLSFYAFDKSFLSIRQHYYPDYKLPWDDYAQYMPAVVMLGLKASGVESKSTWKRMLLADAVSAGIMAVAVNTMKYTIQRTRPNMRANNSYPSGHTATAFMTAQMLHREYGHLSPWYSIGAYSCAGLVGMARLARNKHYLSDVLAGAGIGIISVELGYLISDLILKDPRSKVTLFDIPNTSDRSPSFIGLQTGLRSHFTEYTLKSGGTLSLDYGSYFGLEGAWFANRNWGVGGNLRVSANKYSVDDELQYDKASDTYTMLGMYQFALGPYHSQPLGSHFRIESKALLGYIMVDQNDTVREEAEVSNTCSATVGTSVSYWTKENLSFKIYCDYTVMPNFINDKTGTELSVGLSTNYMF